MPTQISTLMPAGFLCFPTQLAMMVNLGRGKPPDKQHALTVLNSREISTAESTGVQARMRARSILHCYCWEQRTSISKNMVFISCNGSGDRSQEADHTATVTVYGLTQNHVVENLNREIWLWSRLLMDLLRYAFFRFINELVMCNFILNIIVSTSI